MNCEDVEADLDAWGLGLLSGSRRREIEAHLGYCGACADGASALRGVVGRLSAFPASVDAAALEARILARAFAPRAKPRRRWTEASAAACLLVLLSVPERPPGPAPFAPPPALARIEISAPLMPTLDVEEPFLAADAPLPPPPEPAEAVASYTWEEAMAAPSPWDVDIEPPPLFSRASPLAGPVFAGWIRDEELGGAALVGLSLGF